MAKRDLLVSLAQMPDLPTLAQELDRILETAADRGHE